MQLIIYQEDAFAEKVFSGNPAAVIPLQKWLPDETMQNIASENNLSETAFFIPEGSGFHIRWFTPVSEVDLCGHATLASAHIIFNELDFAEKEIHFQSRSGILKVNCQDDLIILDFPVSPLNEISMPTDIFDAFELMPEKCIKGKEDIMLVFEKEENIKELKPNFEYLKRMNARGVIATAKSTQYDFVSRFFAPLEGIDEDPVTGSAHTMLIPYWTEKQNKSDLDPKQISPRGGMLYCKNKNERVHIAGKAVTYLKGTISF
jgi:PhzF family phenazine biosynthesis protein